MATTHIRGDGDLAESAEIAVILWDEQSKLPPSPPSTASPKVCAVSQEPSPSLAGRKCDLRRTCRAFAQ
jgi:hypothetical protein